ncbi:MAG TPA: hypothetical protein VGN34_18970 [Ktedonobacteraceae bacterium]
MYNDPTQQRFGQPSPQQPNPYEQTRQAPPQFQPGSYEQTRQAAPQFQPGSYEQTRQAPPQFQPGSYEQTRQAAPQFQPSQQPFYNQQPALNNLQPPVNGFPAQSVAPKAKSNIFAQIGLKPALVAGGIIVAMLVLIIGVAVIAAQANSYTSTVNNYYTAVKQQDYTEAYSFIVFPTTAGSQGARLYTLVAQGYDKSRGPIASAHIQSSTVNGSSATVVETVQRQGAAYTVRLTLSNINGMWKITAFTAI